jgi:hypothetical protein
MLKQAIDNKKIVCGLFLDFAKAFDTVNHDILLKKLYGFGIRGLSLEWFKSYLDNRKQYVKINNVESSLQIISCGVPQGSTLGPLLFLIYIKDYQTFLKNWISECSLMILTSSTLM